MNKSPYATGDPTHYGWGPTDFGIYSGAPVGVLGGMIQATNVEKILKIDLLKTDFFHATAYPTYLYYNPFPEAKTVELNLPSGSYDIYDAVTDSYLAKNVSGLTSFTIPVSSALVAVLAPVDGKRVHNADGKILINDVFVGLRTK